MTSGPSEASNVQLSFKTSQRLEEEKTRPETTMLLHEELNTHTKKENSVQAPHIRPQLGQVS